MSPLAQLQSELEAREAEVEIRLEEVIGRESQLEEELRKLMEVREQLAAVMLDVF